MYSELIIDKIKNKNRRIINSCLLYVLQYNIIYYDICMLFVIFFCVSTIIISIQIFQTAFGVDTNLNLNFVYNILVILYYIF